MSQKERSPTTPEHRANTEALTEINTEHHDRLRHNLEKADANHKEKSDALEHAQREALERASSLKEVAETEKSPAQKRVIFTRRQREASFKHQMEAVQSEMSPSERRFSKVIHNKTVETASDTLGATIARPNALLAGSISAFLLVTIVYLLAKYYGYRLSGFETIGAFVLGWVLGLIYDYVRLLVSGQKK